jgi:hypothetical protein
LAALEHLDKVLLVVMVLEVLLMAAAVAVGPPPLAQMLQQLLAVTEAQEQRRLSQGHLLRMLAAAVAVHLAAEHLPGQAAQAAVGTALKWTEQPEQPEPRTLAAVAAAVQMHQAQEVRVGQALLSSATPIRIQAPFRQQGRLRSQPLVDIKYTNGQAAGASHFDSTGAQIA